MENSRTRKLMDFSVIGEWPLSLHGLVNLMIARYWLSFCALSRRGSGPRDFLTEIDRDRTHVPRKDTRQFQIAHNILYTLYKSDIYIKF